MTGLAAVRVLVAGQYNQHGCQPLPNAANERHLLNLGVPTTSQTGWNVCLAGVLSLLDKIRGDRSLLDSLRTGFIQAYLNLDPP